MVSSQSKKYIDVGKVPRDENGMASLFCALEVQDPVDLMLSCELHWTAGAFEQ